MPNSIVDNNAIISLIDDAIADSLGPDWTSYDAAHHVMQWLTDAGLQVVPVPTPTTKPFAYCCAEAGGGGIPKFAIAPRPNTAQPYLRQHASWSTVAIAPLLTKLFAPNTGGRDG